MCNEVARRIELGLIRQDFAELRIPLRFSEGVPNMAPLPSVRITDRTVIIRAARDGRVINVAHKFFRGGLATENRDEANFVQVLHDDGTTAIYAHLQMDTIRVRPGQRLQRGEYIANSGNTGFSSGPHLHFVVLRNVGLRSESVPVQFAGPGDAGVTPQTGHVLTAH